MSKLMNEMQANMQALDQLIKGLAADRLDHANDVFKEKHGYDLRKSKNPDYLKFMDWQIRKECLVLRYQEVTPHDCPYEVELALKLDKLFISEIDND